VTQLTNRFFSQRIVQIALAVFIIVTVVNSIIFGVAEFNDQKNTVLREFKNISTVVSEPFASAIWKNDKAEIKKITEKVLQNGDITGIRVVNYDNKFEEVKEIRDGRKISIVKATDLIYHYNGKDIKVAKLFLYTDRETILSKCKKVFLLLFLKTVIQTATIIFLILWGFKKLFSDYINAIRRAIQHGDGDDHLETKAPLQIIESKFKTMLEHLIVSYIQKDSKTYLEESGKEEREDKKEEQVEQKDEVTDKKSFNLEQILNFANPNREIFKRYFRDSFFISQASRITGGDIYLFVEIEKNRELLLLVVDYGNLDGVDAIELALILKEIERDILVKHSVNNRLFSISKILDFTNRKIRSRFAENGSTAIDNAEFKGIAIYVDKLKEKIEYSSHGVLIFRSYQNNLSLFDDYGLYNDRLATGVPQDDAYREHTIEVDKEGTTLYVVTDGYFKQTKRDKKREEIGKNGFIEVLKKVQKDPFISQGENFLYEFNERKGDKPQIDDVTIMGLKF
jgi:hypothetical protein